MIIAVARSDEVPAMVALWNRCLPRYPLEEANYRRRLEGPYHRSALHLVARAEAGLLGFALGRLPDPEWSRKDSGHIAQLLVAPEARRRGIGRALLARLGAEFAAAGCSRVVFGAEPNHLLPGIPTEVDRGTWSFLLGVGARPGAAEFDLHLDLRRALPEIALAEPFELTEGEHRPALDFLARVFPGRWHDEVGGYTRAGTTLLTLERHGEVVGFCTLFQSSDRFIGPSLSWRGALPGPVAGLGPIGIDPALRGRGLGSALFLAGARTLQRRGHRDLVIDWTDLTEFYGRAGATIWRSYQRASAALPDLLTGSAERAMSAAATPERTTPTTPEASPQAILERTASATPEARA